MKILAIGDPHGKLPRNLTRIIRKWKPEVILCTGDIGGLSKNYFKRGYLTKKERENSNKSFRAIVDKLCSYNLPVLILRGNFFLSKEGSEVTKRSFGAHKNLFYKKDGVKKIKGEAFVFFDNIWEDDKRAGAYGRKQMKLMPSRKKNLLKNLKENSKCILFSHAPPYGSVDRVKNRFTNFKWKHVGSKVLRDAIKKYTPKYVFCSHIHEAKGKSKIGKTIIYNVGSHGDYAVIDLEKNKILESNFLR